MQKLMIGIDVSKKLLDVAYWQESKAIFLGKFQNDGDGFQTIAQELENISGNNSVFLVMEPTGGYEQPLAHFAHNQGWQVSLPNPKQVRDWIRGTGRRAKTDRIDALMLAQYGAVQNPPTWNPLPEEVAQLESMLERLQNLKTVNGVGDKLANILLIGMHRFASLTDSKGTSNLYPQSLA